MADIKVELNKPFNFAIEIVAKGPEQKPYLSIQDVGLFPIDAELKLLASYSKGVTIPIENEQVIAGLLMILLK